MKITIDVDLTPEELRQFLGLPNVEKLQEQLLKNAEQFLKESGSAQYGELIANAMQPMLAYHEWLQRMMTQGGSTQRKDKKRE